MNITSITIEDCKGCGGIHVVPFSFDGIEHYVEYSYGCCSECSPTAYAVLEGYTFKCPVNNKTYTVLK